MKSLQEAVDDYVRENNTTKDAFSKKVQIGRSSFFSKMRGTSELSLGEAYRLSRELDCSLDELYEMTVV